jgi:peptidoglycan-associated lipoprotein
MTNRFWVGLALLLIIPGFLMTASCAKKTIRSEPATAGVQAGAGEKGTAADEERARQKDLEEQRLQEERLREEARTRRERAERDAFGNELIHFEYDKSRLLPESKDVLKRKAKWLLANPRVNAVIEGHCDERGTNEYNMALGDRRAQSAKNYLVDLGVPSRRLTTISYGEERPLAFGQNERAWAKNRRAQFVIE